MRCLKCGHRCTIVVICVIKTDNRCGTQRRKGHTYSFLDKSLNLVTISTNEDMASNCYVCVQGCTTTLPVCMCTRIHYHITCIYVYKDPLPHYLYVCVQGSTTTLPVCMCTRIHYHITCIYKTSNME